MYDTLSWRRNPSAGTYSIIKNLHQLAAKAYANVVAIVYKPSNQHDIGLNFQENYVCS